MIPHALRCSAAFIFALNLLACPDDGEDPDVDETIYWVDGVAVVIENAAGPDEVTMMLAVEVFRREAINHWGLDNETDSIIWNELQEVRWTDRDIQSTYDPETSMIETQYGECLVDPLFNLLTHHYHYQLTGVTEVPEVDVAWAADLSATNQETLCTMP